MRDHETVNEPTNGLDPMQEADVSTPSETTADTESPEAPARVRKGLRRIAAAAAILAALAGGSLVLTAVASGGSDSGKPKDAATTDEAKPEKAPVPVSVRQLEAGEISSYISATANLVAENEVQVLAETEGRVDRVDVEEGDWVEAGQVLATLARDDEEIAVSKAGIREADARRAYERARDLMQEDLLSREDFDKVTLEFELAQQELAEARWRLSKTSIKAPFAGRITARTVQAGQHLRPGDELYQVTDYSPLIARIYLPEKDVLGLAEGRSVRITLAAAPDVAFAGRIRQVSPVVDTATGTVKVTVEASSPPRQVRPGSFVTVDVVRETRPGAVLLPREAVVRELQRAHVFVTRGETAEKRDVTLGLEEGELVQALSGVDAGERVIVAGQGGLKDGSRIRVLDPAAE